MPPRHPSSFSFWPHTSFFILLVLFPYFASSKFVIEPCTSSDSCSSLLSYLLPSDLKLSEIASRFQIKVPEILGANSYDPSTPQTQIVPINSLLKIPISCPCVNGIRQSVSTTYTVQPIDSLDSIAAGFGRLVSADQIRNLNGIGSGQPLAIGTQLKIPLPCTCFDNSDNGVPSVYLSYVVRSGDSLSSIADTYGSTVADLISVNQLGTQDIQAGDILAVPIPACSSINMNLYSDRLLVHKGSYSMTAFNCIKCSCNSSDLNMQCSSFPLYTSCHRLQCKGSNLFIGDVSEKQSSRGCNITSCLYRGYLGHTILSSSRSYIRPKCLGNQSQNIDSMAPSPAANEPKLPFSVPSSSIPVSAPGSHMAPQIAAPPLVSSSETSNEPVSLTIVLTLAIILYSNFADIFFIDA
ncbi:LysM domain-containing GPI-anchored protein 1 [Nymphaea thermarum]|nr:LysM domain-containing GPI-anchored protein 1 [Nymphaea thermarum]